MEVLKKILRFTFGYDSEYTKREMSLFTRAVLILLLFTIPLFLVTFVAHMKFGLGTNLVKTYWTAYLKFARWLVTAYGVTWIGQMGKAYLGKREEENMKFKRRQLGRKNKKEDV